MEGASIPVAIVGGGNIAHAIVKGAIEAGALAPRDAAVAEPDATRREVFRALGVRPCKSAAEVMNWLIASEREHGQGQVMLAIKPQSLADVAGELRANLSRPTGTTRRVVISLLAGTPTAKVRDLLGPTVAVVRAMPNTAAQVRRATTAVALGAGAREGDEQRAVAIFSAVGRVANIDESLMDAFTAVVGSGPAYVFYLAEAMIKAAVDVGFDPEMADWIVRWTITGAGALLDAADQPPQTLRAAVTSKGGTTSAAAAVLDEARVMETFVRAIRAARDRGAELSRA